MANMFYNGHKLPNIKNVWSDKTLYPYAIISRATAGKTFLHLSRNPFVYDVSKKKMTGSGYCLRFVLEYSTWKLSYRGTITSDTDISDYIYNAYWTSVDILCDDGTLYLAASTPVIFYARINHIDAFMLGQRLRPSVFEAYELFGWDGLESTEITFGILNDYTWQKLENFYSN